MEINATFVGQAVAFLIFAVLCMKYVWPPLMNALEKRQKEIADGLTAAEKAKKSLELANENAAQTVRDAKAQAQKIIEEANKIKAENESKNADVDVKKIEELIAKRTEARANKDWATADAIRDELAAMKVVGKDAKDGITWEIQG